jgi:hypothetical protein
MRRQDSKSKSAKQTSKKRTLKIIQLSTPAVARRIHQLIYSAQERENRALRQVVDELLWVHGNPLDADKSDKAFERHFIKAAQKIEKEHTHERRPYYEGLQITLSRLDDGETLADIFKSYPIRGEDEPALDLGYLSEHLDAGNTPVSVRAFIENFKDKFLAYAGMNGSEYEQESLPDRLAAAAQHVGERKALQIALKVAIETLARYAPAVSYHTRGTNYQQQAEQFAAVIYHKDAPEGFTKTFEAIYDQLFVAETNWSHPSMIRASYAAMREFLDDNNYCGTADGIANSLLKLIETQLPEHVREVACLAGKKGGQG